LDLLDEVAGILSWDNTDLAQQVWVDIDTVGRWRSTGLPNGYLRDARALRDAARKGCLDGLDIFPLPWGADAGSSRLKKPPGPHTPTRVALMDQGEGLVRLVR
jgi:hypothetical protein